MRYPRSTGNAPTVSNWTQTCVASRRIASSRVASCRVVSCRVAFCVTLCRVNCRPKRREKLTMFRDVSSVEWLFAFVYRRSNASRELTNLWFYTRITFHYEFCIFFYDLRLRWHIPSVLISYKFIINFPIIH